MANFEPCFEKVLKLEGGYKLHTVPGDRGGTTYAGIARAKNPRWEGWVKIDKGEFDQALIDMVKAFFKREYWDKIQGDVIGFESVAYNLYEFGIKNGIGTAVSLCQKIIGVKVDGGFGSTTLRALNNFCEEAKDEKIFVLAFSLMKIFRDNEIVQGDSRKSRDVLVSNQKFLCGWINRTKAGLEHWGVQYP